MMFQRLFCLGSFLLLAACQQATTVAPVATGDELARERQTQSELARQQADNTLPDVTQEQIVARVVRVSERVKPHSIQLCRELFSAKQSRRCEFDIGLAKEGGLNAYADGEKVVIFPEMVAFTQNDTQLALILAHELAHNIMRHPDNQKQNVAIGGILGTIVDQIAASQGINTGGALSQLGAQGAVLKYSSGFEREADYVALYILARSGYNISDAPAFWRRMSQQNPDSIYVGTTHPTNPERYLTLQKTIDEIKTKQQRGAPLLPELNQS